MLVTLTLANPLKNRLSQAVSPKLEAVRPLFGHTDTVSFGQNTGAIEIPPKTSPVMRQVYEKMAKVAPYKTTVMLLGDSGVGKSYAAGKIHKASPRADKPFVVVNCAAIPEALLESELFGHKKGAFTGASADYPGKFQSATGGTIFLDEIGELSAAAQAKLLHVLEGKQQLIQAVGASSSTPVDVRVIVATNRDLRADVKAGRFRLDLLERLNVFPITIPPLKSRVDEIPYLVGKLLPEIQHRLGTPNPLVVTEPAMLEMLTHVGHRMPGNIRSLEHVLERAAINSGGEPIGKEHLEFEGEPQEGPLNVVHYVAPHQTDQQDPLHAIRYLLEKLPKGVPFPPEEAVREMYLRAANTYFFGNAVAMAEPTGISRGTLVRRLTELGLRGPAAVVGEETDSPIKQAG